MKKILCAALALLLAAGSLAACGSPAASGTASSEVLYDPASRPASALPAPSQGTPSVPSASGPSASEPPAPTTFRLTVPEGYTLARIGMLLEEQGICADEDFVAAAQTGDFSEFACVAAMPYNENRAITLEGYLFPDTYEFYLTATPDDIIRKMLRNTDAKYAQLADAVANSGRSLDEIVTLASIIEKEGHGGEELAVISSVLHNRLAIGQKLECDVTINYVEGVLGYYLEDGVERYKYYYNTYRCDALPAGAICNPGMAALQAALGPADTPYYYFLTDGAGNYLYGATLEDHEANKRQAGLA